MRFSEMEIQQLAKAWIAISFAFALVWRRVGEAYGLNFVQIFLVAALTVGVAFIVHELAHKFVAQKYGCWAEFRSFDIGLLLAVVMAWMAGIVFAAPGAVMISGLVSREENGRIAAAGPITNLVLAGLFLVVSWTLSVVSINPLDGGLGSAVLGSRWFSFVISFGFSINAWLAFFNLIPFGPLDGAKILSWSQGIWLALIGVAGILTFLV